MNEVRGKRSAAATPRSSSQRKDLYTAIDTKCTHYTGLSRKAQCFALPKAVSCLRSAVHIGSHQLVQLRRDNLVRCPVLELPANGGSVSQRRNGTPRGRKVKGSPPRTKNALQPSPLAPPNAFLPRHHPLATLDVQLDPVPRVAPIDVPDRLSVGAGADQLVHPGLVPDRRLFRPRKGVEGVPVSQSDQGAQLDVPEPVPDRKCPPQAESVCWVLPTRTKRGEIDQMRTACPGP